MKHYFQTPNPDLGAIQKRLSVWFKQHEFEVDAAEADGEYVIQARKGGNMRAILGTSQAFLIKLTLSDEPNEFVYESTIGAWSANLTGAGISGLFTGGLTWVTGAMGAAWAIKIERDIVDYLETSLRFRKAKSVNDAGEVIDAAGSSSQSLPFDLSDNAILGTLRTAAQRVLPPTSTNQPPSAASQPSPAAQPLTASEYAMQQAQVEFKKLFEAHRAGILNEHELAAKRKGVQAKIIDWEVQFLVKEKSEKLKAALASGILEQQEYDTKLAALEPAARQEVIARRQDQAKNAEPDQTKDTQLAKLKAALDAGVLTAEEYEAKVGALR